MRSACALPPVPRALCRPAKARPRAAARTPALSDPWVARGVAPRRPPSASGGCCPCLFPRPIWGGVQDLHHTIYKCSSQRRPGGGCADAPRVLLAGRRGLFALAGVRGRGGHARLLTRSRARSDGQDFYGPGSHLLIDVKSLAAEGDVATARIAHTPQGAHLRKHEHTVRNPRQ
jgi:hypothetical protein